MSKDNSSYYLHPDGHRKTPAERRGKTEPQVVEQRPTVALGERSKLRAAERRGRQYAQSQQPPEPADPNPARRVLETIRPGTEPKMRKRLEQQAREFDQQHKVKIEQEKKEAERQADPSFVLMMDHFDAWEKTSERFGISAESVAFVRGIRDAGNTQLYHEETSRLTSEAYDRQQQKKEQLVQDAGPSQAAIIAQSAVVRELEQQVKPAAPAAEPQSEGGH